MKILCVVAAFLLSACSSGDTSNAKVNEAGGNEAKAVTVESSEQNTLAGSSDQNNAVFPDYAPQFRGSEIVEHSDRAFNDFTSTQVHLTTTETVQNVSEFYRASLAKSKNMPITFDESTPEKLSIMAGELPDGSVATSISAKIENGKTNIYILLNKPKS